MNLTPQQRLERAHVSLIRDPEYMMLAGIIMYGKTEVVDDPAVTACTDGVNTKYSQQFIATLSDQELMGLVLHEKMHCAFKHTFIWRWMYKEDPMLANMACDFVINLPINDRYLKDRFVKLPDGGCLDEQYRGMDAGEVFRKLKQQYPNGGSSAGKSGNAGFDQHDWDSTEDMTPDEVDELARTIDGALRQGGILASKAGVNVDRALLDMLEPKVDWREALREFITNSKVGDDYSSYRRINRRFQSQDLMLPTTFSDRIFRIAVGVDTSGSIGNKELAAFLSEAQSIFDSVKPEMVDLIYWGHNVAAHETYDEAALSTLRESTKPKGGGGTDPECMSAYLNEHNIKPDCIVMLTDGEVFGSWGTDWPAPILWCIADNRHITAANGVTVHM
jgi:predicted metal-dependent peptidase